MKQISNNSLRINLVFLVICLISLISFTNTNLRANDNDPQGKILKEHYPGQLYQQGDYFRVVSEILKLRFEDQSLVNDQNLNRFLLNSYFHLENENKLQLEAFSLLESQSLTSDQEQTREIAQMLSASLLHSGKEPLAKETWQTYCTPNLCEPFPSSDQITGILDPQQAKFYSSILPGSGMIMSGEYAKATVSFLLNVLFAYQGYQFAVNKQYGIAGILIFFEIGWYTGGKNASLESAIHYNQQLVNNTQHDWINTIFPLKSQNQK